MWSSGAQAAHDAAVAAAEAAGGMVSAARNLEGCSDSQAKKDFYHSKEAVLKWKGKLVELEGLDGLRGEFAAPGRPDVAALVGRCKEAVEAAGMSVGLSKKRCAQILAQILAAVAKDEKVGDCLVLVLNPALYQQLPGIDKHRTSNHDPWYCYSWVNATVAFHENTITLTPLVRARSTNPKHRHKRMNPHPTGFGSAVPA
jgi:hypothetical protein